MRYSALVLILVLALTACGTSGRNYVMTARVETPSGQYVNPLPIKLPDGKLAESCPDPSIIHGQQPGDDFWYLYCTNEKFSDAGAVHLMPISKSADLINWTYVGDVFSRMPAWVGDGGWLWAPDIQFFNGRYYLYYAVSNTLVGGSAIFVATSDSPTGPWSASSTPVVAPERSPCCGGGMRDVIDPFVLSDGDQKYIMFGSFNGGIVGRLLSADGMSSDRSTEVQIGPPDRYEAPYIIRHDGYFYLFASAGRCCSGEFSGYGVFAARSTNPLGPYIDRDGNSLLEARVGGTPVLAMNGNKWIGPGHNAVATDASGQDWIVYHAIDVNKPVYNRSWTRRPVLIDAIQWVDGWPRVRGGAGPSEDPQPAPAVQAGESGAYTAIAPIDLAGTLITSLSDEFNGNSLASQWTWIRKPAPSTYGIANGMFRFDTQAADFYGGAHSGAILSEPAPQTDYMVEVKLSNTVPLTGSYNFAQSGIVIYKDDSNYMKLDLVAIDDTRQIEFAKQQGTGIGPLYGSSYLASPAENTYLRIVRKAVSGTSKERYTAYSSHDGQYWERGGTWTNTLGSNTKIGLVSMSVAGFSSYFDFVRVYQLQ